MGTDLQLVLQVTGKKPIIWIRKMHRNGLKSQENVMTALQCCSKFSDLPLYGLKQSSLSKAILVSPAHRVLPKKRKKEELN